MKTTVSVQKLKSEAREINILLESLQDSTHQNIISQKIQTFATQSINHIQFLQLQKQLLKSKKFHNDDYQNRTLKKEITYLKNICQMQKQQIRNYQYNVREIKAKKYHRNNQRKFSSLNPSIKVLTQTQQVQCDNNCFLELKEFNKLKKQNSEMKKIIQSLNIQYSQKLNELQSYKELTYRIIEDKKIGEVEKDQQTINQRWSETNSQVQDYYQSQSQSVCDQNDEILQIDHQNPIIPQVIENNQIKEEGIIWGLFSTMFRYFKKSKN